MMMQELLEWVFSSTLARTFAAIVFLTFGFYWFMTSRFRYWRCLGVPYAEPRFLFGSLKDLITQKIDVGRAFQRIYNSHKVEKFVGAFYGRNPILILNDLELIKFVLTKEFQHFTDRGNIPKVHKDFLQNNLFNMEGEEWREMRRKLSPTFTAGKMKMMFSLMEEAGNKLTEEVRNISEYKTTVDINALISRFTSDIIASCAYGIEVDSIRNPDSKFYRMTQKMFISTRLKLLKRTFLVNFPKLFNLLGMKITDRELEEYLPGLVKATIAYRRESNVYRGDFLDLLLNIGRGKGHDPSSSNNGVSAHTGAGQETISGLTLEEISGQTFIFFMAGFETAASTLSFCLYELARRPDLQERVRQEIAQARANHQGSLTYEALQSMSYVDQVINETLRLYASLPVLTRLCVSPIPLPGTDPPLVVDRGVKIIIPTFAVHHDPRYYPDPDRFDPDRFAEHRVKERHPYTHLPFGEGPRMCIGMRFGKMQVKMGLCSLLPQFHFTLAPCTPEPMTISTTSLVTKPACPVTLTITPVDQGKP